MQLNPHLPEFDNHRVVLQLANDEFPLIGFIAIHRGGLERPAFGATRLWRYVSDMAALQDALKLSKIMTYKSALAGLRYGGAKAVLLHPANIKKRSRLLSSYARLVNTTAGHFVTGVDVGITPKDLTAMSRYTKYLVGFHVDPVAYTMLGVWNGIQVALEEIFGSGEIHNRTFALQGVGKTGQGLLQHLHAKAKKIYVTDINPQALCAVKKLFSGITIVDPQEIVKFSVDVFCPCALSGVINAHTLKTIKTRIVAGSANCQLENEEAGISLYRSGILYIPDYVINAGGLISVVDEYEHKTPNDARIKRSITNISTTIRKIIAASKKTGKPTNVIADAMARKIAKTYV